MTPKKQPVDLGGSFSALMTGLSSLPNDDGDDRNTDNQRAQSLPFLDDDSEDEKEEINVFDEDYHKSVMEFL